MTEVHQIVGAMGWLVAAALWLLGLIVFEMHCRTVKEPAPIWALYLFWPVIVLFGLITALLGYSRK